MKKIFGAMFDPTRLLPVTTLTLIIGFLWICFVTLVLSANQVSNDTNSQMDSLTATATAQAEITDWVDNSSFRQGYYQACIELAQMQEETCLSRAYELERP